VVNNLETLANIPLITLHGGKWFAKIGTAASTGTKIVALSGTVHNPVGLRFLWNAHQGHH